MSYILYAVLLTSALLYFRFPASQFTTYCREKIESLFAGTACQIAAIHYAFPVGLHFEKIALSSVEQKDKPLFFLSSLTIRPDIHKLGSNFRFQGRAYSGNFSGMLARDEENSFTVEDIRVQGVQLDGVAVLEERLARKIRGKLDFSGNYSAAVRQYLAGRASGKIKIYQAQCALLEPVLGLDMLDIQALEADLQLAERALVLKKGKMTGNELHADFSGNVMLIEPWQLSALAIQTSITPQLAYLNARPAVKQEVAALQVLSKTKQVAAVISGPLQKPSLRLGR